MIKSSGSRFDKMIKWIKCFMESSTIPDCNP